MLVELQETFGGHLVHQLIGRGGGCTHASNREEPFTCVGLDIESRASLQSSLEFFVEGELLQVSKSERLLWLGPASLTVWRGAGREQVSLHTV